ncbi:hypothetical protein ES707_02334 [subsurface metagenome]
MGNDKVKSGRQARKFSQASRKNQIFIVIGVIAIISALGGVGFMVYAYVIAQAQAPAATTSNIFITDFTSREVLDELCPVTVRGDKGEITETEHIYDITYYEIVSTEVMPADFDEDLSEYDYIMITPNPDEGSDGFWTTYDYLFANLGRNRNFYLFGYHEATDLYGIPLNIVDGTAWDLVTNTNGTIPIWFPTITKTELHQGKYFRITDDLADLSQTTLDRLWNEKYYRNMPTLFALADDIADHDKTGDYAMITETFAIEFDFNDTISTVDGEDLQVNFTADCDVSFLVEIDADKLYFITTESWDTLYGNFEMFFEVFMGKNISVSIIKAGRVVIPKRYFGTDYTFTSSQTLATAA